MKNKVSKTTLYVNERTQNGPSFQSRQQLLNCRWSISEHKRKSNEMKLLSLCISRKRCYKWQTNIYPNRRWR